MRQSTQNPASSIGTSPKELLLATPFSSTEEGQLTSSILHATTGLELEMALEQVIRKGTRKQGFRRRIQGGSAQNIKPKTMLIRAKTLWERMRPIVRKGASLAGTAAIGWAVPKALNYITSILSNLELPEQYGLNSEASNIESARRAVQLLGNASMNLVNNPEAIPARLAVEMEMKRMARLGQSRKRINHYGKRRQPGYRARSKKEIRPWFRRRIPYPVFLPQSLAEAIPALPFWHFDEDQSSGNDGQQGGWYRRHGNVIVVLNCDPRRIQDDRKDMNRI